jgi:ABC-2 type transport system permease protein
MATTTPHRPVVADPVSIRPPRGGGPFTGTATLVRFALRRDRFRIPAWLVGITAVQVGGAAMYPGLYPTAVDRRIQATIVVENPAMRAMTGPVHGLDQPTYGALLSNEFLGLVAVVVALMSVLLLVRHTRAEEEAGRAELVLASGVGRYAPLAAALVTAAGASLVLGLLVALGLGGLGIESMGWSGSFVFGGALAAVGLVFAAVAAVAAQVTAYARAAAGVAGAVIGVAYAVRAIGDMADNGLSWLSPIGWAQATAPYVRDDVWPLALALAAALGLSGLAFRLAARRDHGAGLVASRPGTVAGSRWLVSPLGFAWRLQRTALLWWSVAMLLVGIAYGSAVDILEEYADNEIVQELVAAAGGTTLTESWLSVILTVTAIVATVAAVIAALRPRREELSGRAEPVLATALARTTWVATHAAIAMAGGVVLLAVTGAALGGTGALVTGDTDLFGQVLGASVAYAPALWLTTALAVAVFGLAPRASGVVWALLVYAVLVVYLGGLLRLPQWMLNLSPYTHVPGMPAAEFTIWPLAALTAMAAVLVAVGLYGFRRRDLD